MPRWLRGERARVRVRAYRFAPDPALDLLLNLILRHKIEPLVSVVREDNRAVACGRAPPPPLATAAAAGRTPRRIRARGCERPTGRPARHGASRPGRNAPLSPARPRRAWFPATRRCHQ